MFKAHNPSTSAPPASAYSHGIEVPAGARMLYLSGQVGVKPDGAMAEGIAAQTEQAWNNVVAVLESAGMGLADIVKITAYVTRPDHVEPYRDARLPFVVDPPAASTAVVVTSLFSPDWLVEVEAVAAKVEPGAP